MRILTKYKSAFDKKRHEEMSFEEYLKRASKDSSLFASPAKRMLTAIGEPELVDTAKDPRLSRIFGNRVIKRYESFSEFYGMEDVVERIVAFFKHADQGLEEDKQILYLLGPVGSAKSSLAEKLKALMEVHPIYVLTDAEGNLSPVNESPLGLLNVADAEELNIPARLLAIKPSPWATKRLEEYDGDLTKFKVTKVYPSQDKQLAISKTEPGDENNQDISTLVGKLDIRKLEFYSQNDPDAYNYSGGLCLSNQGILDFVEMFKAPIKMLHPLLTATQEKNYKGTEAISAIPFDGIVIAHSNVSEWTNFRNDPNNEAFLDRICIIKVPYCLRVDEEIKVYQKLLKNSDLAEAPCAPDTLKMLAEFCILSRIEEPKNSKAETKMKVYNGENLREVDNKAKSLQEYKELATTREGFEGISTRDAFKIISKVYNFDSREVAANGVHLLYILEQYIDESDLPEDKRIAYLTNVKKYLAEEFAKRLKRDIQTAYLDSYGEFGQAMFDRYILYADHWTEDTDYRDPDTGQMYDRAALNAELEKIEKPAEISNPKDFRHEVVKFALRYRSAHNGENPKWTSYSKLRKVIEANMFSKTEDILPVISFSGQGSKQDKEKHQAFLDKMKASGYTANQVRLMVEWFMRYNKQ